jgi:hypothetical protein
MNEPSRVSNIDALAYPLSNSGVCAGAQTFRPAFLILALEDI